MKTKYNPLVKRSLIVVGCLMLFAMTSRGTDPVSHQSFLDQLRTFEKMGDQDREACLDENAQYMLRMKEILLHNLVSTNDGVRFYSAFFLGVYRFPEAASPLASIISVEDNMKWRHLPAWGRYPAMSALMRIGNPSIPAVIGNLEESDDAKVRELSLAVLNYIDNDKDITQLRLQKALKAEKDPQKQTRLQAAIKSLPESRSP